MQSDVIVLGIHGIVWNRLKMMSETYNSFCWVVIIVRKGFSQPGETKKRLLADLGLILSLTCDMGDAFPMENQSLTVILKVNTVEKAS